MNLPVLFIVIDALAIAITVYFYRNTASFFLIIPFRYNVVLNLVIANTFMVLNFFFKQRKHEDSIYPSIQILERHLHIFVPLSVWLILLALICAVLVYGIAAISIKGFWENNRK
jgi:hypothetical protein